MIVVNDVLMSCLNVTLQQLMMSGCFYLSLRASSDIAIKQLNLRDEINSKHHSDVRHRARTNGNVMQVELLRQRIEEENRNR